MSYHPPEFTDSSLQRTPDSDEDVGLAGRYQTGFSGRLAGSTTRPSLIIVRSLRTLAISASGSASSTSRSASLPVSIVPRSFVIRQASAPFFVAATIACDVVIP